MTGSVFARIEKGKILGAYNHWDFMGLWGRLDYLPPDAFERGLRGEKIA